MKYTIDKEVEKFNARWTPEPFSGCWLWTGAGSRYGRTSFFGVNDEAHRISYRLFRGEIPDGLCVLHSCDTPPCVNPAHLWLGTFSDNRRDSIKKGRGVKNFGEHCPAHILTEAEVLVARAEYRPDTPGFDSPALARKYKVAERTMCNALNGTTWKYLPKETRTISTKARAKALRASLPIEINLPDKS